MVICVSVSQGEVRGVREGPAARSDDSERPDVRTCQGEKLSAVSFQLSAENRPEGRPPVAQSRKPGLEI